MISDIGQGGVVMQDSVSWLVCSDFNVITKMVLLIALSTKKYIKAVAHEYFLSTSQRLSQTLTIMQKDVSNLLNLHFFLPSNINFYSPFSMCKFLFFYDTALLPYHSGRHLRTSLWAYLYTMPSKSHNSRTAIIACCWLSNDTASKIHLLSKSLLIRLSSFSEANLSIQTHVGLSKCIESISKKI